MNSMTHSVVGKESFLYKQGILTTIEDTRQEKHI